VEYGFMDSETDVPVLLSEGYARAVGCATMAAVAKVAGLQKQQLYRVQVGAFSEQENAKKLLEKLKNSGFEGFIVGATQDGR
jgi:N-acetylmuramoyl-L-alanine amidase